MIGEWLLVLQFRIGYGIATEIVKTQKECHLVGNAWKSQSHNRIYKCIDIYKDFR